jgi:hypothetical protein
VRGSTGYIPLDLDLLPLRHQGSAVHEEPVLTGRGLFLPGQLAVVDERVVSVILFHLLSATLLLAAFGRFETIRASHGSVSVHLAVPVYVETQILVRTLARRQPATGLVVSLQCSPRGGDPG